MLRYNFYTLLLYNLFLTMVLLSKQNSKLVEIVFEKTSINKFESKNNFLVKRMKGSKYVFKSRDQSRAAKTCSADHTLAALI